MTMKIASYNVENLFRRAVAFSGDADPAEAQAVLAAHGEINGLLRKPVYEVADRSRILELLTELGLRESDDGSPLVMLRQNRGQLVRRRQNGDVEVVAGGRGDWLGWVELKTEAVDEITTQNTARVVKDLDADVLAVVEAETRHSLRDFSRVLLRQVGGRPFEHSMLVEGNDDRGINVGLMTKDAFAIGSIHTHIFDRTGPNAFTFSRDCPEYLIRTPGGNEILVLVIHFKSKRGGGGDARRLAQAKRVKEIVEQRLPSHPNLAVVGDLNDTPDSDTLAPLLAGTPLADISTHANFDDGDLPGTFGTQKAANKIDYVLLSPNLMNSVSAGGVLRTGVFTASGAWDMLPTVTTKAQQASDHAAIWAELELA